MLSSQLSSNRTGVFDGLVERVDAPDVLDEVDAVVLDALDEVNVLEKVDVVHHLDKVDALDVRDEADGLVLDDLVDVVALLGCGVEGRDLLSPPPPSPGRRSGPGVLWRGVRQETGSPRQR